MQDSLFSIKVHHIKVKRLLMTQKPFTVACLEGLEPPTYWFVASHSIQLSYRHIYRTVSIIPRIMKFVKLFFEFFSKKYTFHSLSRASVLFGVKKSARGIGRKGLFKIFQVQALRIRHRHGGIRH